MILLEVKLYAAFLLLLALPSSSSAGSLKEDLADCLRDGDYDVLLKTVQEGLPNITTPHHVVIVGAGMAGLTAAMLLEDAGHQVTILEANSRIGGRVETYRNKEEGWYAELGAMRIPSFHRIVLWVAAKLGVKMNSFVMDDPNTYYLVNRVKKRTYAVKNNPGLLGYKVEPNEMGKSADELLQQALQKVKAEVQAEGCKAAFQKYDHYSVKEYLKEVGGLSLEAIRMIGDLLNEQSLMHTALTEMIYDQTDINDNSTYYEVTGGSDHLPNAFLNVLHSTLLLNSKVVRINQSDTGVTVEYQTSDKSWEKFWESEGIRGGKSITDQPSRFIYYPSHGFSKNQTVGVLLASYTWSDDSLLFLGASDEDLKEVALRDLAQIHGARLCCVVPPTRFAADSAPTS
ncbi:hypothetical protein OJAV_G00184930 [Oryzias javanicus]|uniref:L-amino-acid oxidase n=1 Tax=Oryzias javanicus TaxID=123683 RepID=A0A437CD99_ORYJA|nr:hypothetical protein OJAV_G00184930 [Oryzias javanicus]